ncbi:peptidase family M13, partial [Teladorsagia circumcincta]
IPKFNISLNGTLSLGENTADNEGLKIAYKAYRHYISKQKNAGETETLDGFTPDQMFFLGASSLWCRKNAEFTVVIGLTDEHSPAEYRVNQVFLNAPEFASAFHCSPSSKMNPKTRCSIW